MLLPRFLTSLIGVPILLLSIWWGQIPFFILMAGVILLGLEEFYGLAESASWPVSKRTGIAAGAILLLSIALFGTRMGWDKPLKAEIFFTPAVFSFLMAFFGIAHVFSKDKENAFINLAVTWLGLFYVVFSLSHLFLIRDLRPEGMSYTFFLFLVTWALDIGAYFGGMKFGKHKLCESVSPKKTWEGSAAGALAGLAVAALFHLIFMRDLGAGQAFLLALIIVTLSQVSDLSESLFKRNVQVKDSGDLLPGHGGILDRFDSFLLTAPVYYYTLVLIVK